MINESIRDYSFPCVCYDFEKDREINLTDMKEVENIIRGDLLSGKRSSVKNGLSNVLYWGFSKVGYRNKRVERFRQEVTKGQLHEAASCFKSIKGDALRKILKIKMPQFSGMSFISKVRMFLDPEKYVILDQQILKMNNESYPTVLKDIKFSAKETQIRVSEANCRIYQNWCDKCRHISTNYFECAYRAVDIERGFFTLIQKGKVALAAGILSNS